jgi:LemA protein
MPILIIFLLYIFFYWIWKFLEDSFAIFPLITMILIALIPITLWVIFLYNSLVRLREKCNSSLANISTEENRKLEIYLKVEKLIKDGSNYEGALQQKITTIRENGSLTNFEKIRMADQLFAKIVSENYPSLKAVEIFTKYQDEISVTENKIQKAKEKFNLSVEEFNQRVLVFPSNIVAKLLQFKTIKYLNNN